MDLLNVPLPIISPECEDPSQYQYFIEKKGLSLLPFIYIVCLLYMVKSKVISVFVY